MLFLINRVKKPDYSRQIYNINATTYAVIKNYHHM